MQNKTLIIILRGHIRSSFESTNLYDAIKILSLFYTIKIYIHTWSIIQSSLSWRFLKENNTTVTNELIYKYFKDLNKYIVHIIIDDDKSINLIGNTNGLLSHGQCPIPLIAWKNYWYGKYKIIDYIYNTIDTNLDNYTILNTRFDIFHLIHPTISITDVYTFVNNYINCEFKENIFLKDAECQGIDNIYLGSIRTIHNLAYHFHNHLDDIISRYSYISHWEYLVFSENKYIHTLSKTIWFLWYQGKDNIPEFIEKVITTWKLYNPNWNIIILDKDNIAQYINITNIFKAPSISVQAFSDFIRLNILYKYGGIWADATLACLRPLDLWVYDCIYNANMWMYHGRDMGRGPASWFIISMPYSYILSKWKNKVNEFLLENENFEFYWMDRQFAYLAQNDTIFLKEWSLVPYLYCEEEYSAHCLAYKTDSYDPLLIDKIIEVRPFVIKLSNHSQYHSNTNKHLLLDKLITSISNKKNIITYSKINWGTHPSFENANFFQMYNNQ